MRDPVFKFEIPKHSMCVPDGRGGIYALCPKDHIPNHNNESQSGTRPGNSSNTTRGNRNNPQEDYRLMRYWNRRRYGALIEDALPASSQLFMEKTGGVILLRRDNDSNFSSLWHLSAPNRRLLLYRGISKHARVVGDVTGTSVIILTTGGRLASILTRVAVNREVDGAYTSSIVFSYDLDIPLDAIKDIVDDASDPTRVFLHCRRRDNSGRNNWKVCRVSSSNDEGVTVEDIYICAKNSRVLSDKEHGIWVWKKPTRDANCARDRGFVHVKGDSTTWTSPLIFPPGTLLGGLPFR